MIRNKYLLTILDKGGVVTIKPYNTLYQAVHAANKQFNLDNTQCSLLRNNATIDKGGIAISVDIAHCK